MNIKIPLHIIRPFLTVSLVALLLSSSFVIDKELFNGIITSKLLWVYAVGTLVLVFISIRGFIQQKVNVKIPDVLVFVFCLWCITSGAISGITHANLSDNFLNACVYLSIYLFVRGIGNRSETIKPIIVIYLSIIGIQSVLGLLQLYGFHTSHHSQFPITGSFHNPGPFSGFAVSGLAMALGINQYTRKLGKEWFIKTSKIIKNSISTKSEGGWYKYLRKRLSFIIKHITKPDLEIFLYAFSQIVIPLLLLVLPATRSRASWLAAIAGCAFISYKFGLFQIIAKYPHFMTSWPKLATRLSVLTVSIFVLTGSAYGLYQFKQGSTNGRLLMWQVSWEMIKDKPILGWGAGGFEAQYGNYQAEWFSSGKGTGEQGLVAGTPDAPFNVFIRIGVEYGIIGVILVVLLLLFVFNSQQNKKSKNITQSYKFHTPNSELKTLNPEPKTQNLDYLLTILQSGLLSILVFSLFSYPLDVAPIVVQVIALIALIANLKPQNSLPQTQNLKPRTQNLLIRIVALVGLITVPYLGYHTFGQYKGHKHWKEAHMLYLYQIHDDAAEEYQLALKYLPNEGLLLQMYGKCLAMSVNNEQLPDTSEQWQKALDILESAKQQRSDPILYTTLGDTYKALGEYAKAESAYLHAWQMVPHKFYPGYLLVKLYDESHQEQKAVQLAEALLHKHVKVNSRAIEEIIDELQAILEKRESSIIKTAI